VTHDGRQKLSSRDGARWTGREASCQGFLAGIYRDAIVNCSTGLTKSGGGGRERRSYALSSSPLYYSHSRCLPKPLPFTHLNALRWRPLLSQNIDFPGSLLLLSCFYHGCLAGVLLACSVSMVGRVSRLLCSRICSPGVNQRGENYRAAVCISGGCSSPSRLGLSPGPCGLPRISGSANICCEGRARASGDVRQVTGRTAWTTEGWLNGISVSQRAGDRRAFFRASCTAPQTGLKPAR